MFNFHTDITVTTGATPGTVQLDATSDAGRRAMESLFFPACVGVEVPVASFTPLAQALTEALA